MLYKAVEEGFMNINDLNIWKVVRTPHEAVDLFFTSILADKHDRNVAI